MSRVDISGILRRIRRSIPRRAILLPVLGGAVVLLSAVLFLASATRFERESLALGPCRVFYDRNGEMLRFVPDERGERHIRVVLEEISPLAVMAFIAAEDERFYRHPGVDPAAVVRAARDNLRSGRIVSGASTITQQLCRLAYPRRRTWYQKFLEAVRSLRIEASLTKGEILEHYLNRVPLGNNLLGVEAASRVYFGKSAGRLTAAEAALLASLPKAPGRLNPYGGNAARLRDRKDWVLERMGELGFLDRDELAGARREAIGLEPRHFPMEASHLVDSLLPAGEGSGPGRVVTTIDLDLQKKVEDILASHRERLAYRGATQAAAVVLSNRGPEVLAMAGSLEHSPRDEGYNNGTLALRSPGSTLKPFLYALALDSGFTAATVLEDVGRRFRFPYGEYLPENFDRRAYGPVSLRNALGNSFNLSAINLLNMVGYGRFYNSLAGVDLINHPERGADHYGLGMVVGNPEVSLLQLASGYAALANGGYHRPAAVVSGTLPGGRRVFSEQAGYIINRILSDPDARAITFAGSAAMNSMPGVAVKTGTSTRYRDCWTAGYTPEHTVAVWVGNFDGRPTWSLSGAAAAAPIFADIIRELYPLGDPPSFEAPGGTVEDWVCSHSGMRPTGNCPHRRREIFIAGTEPDEDCSYHSRGPEAHDLPTRYAGWLHQRYEKGVQGRYRLAGFDRRLEKVFSGSPAIPEKGGERPLLEGKVTIGEKPAEAVSPPGGGVSILYPLDGDRYLMGPGEKEQAVLLKAVCDSPVESLSWFVDGMEYAATAPPYELEGRLSRGRHLISAVGPDRRGDSILIYVE